MHKPESKYASILREFGFQQTMPKKSHDPSVLAMLARLECAMYVEMEPEGVAVTDETGQDWDLFSGYVDLSQFEGFKSVFDLNDEPELQGGNMITIRISRDGE